MMARLADRIRAWPQFLLPQKLLTRCAHRISNSRADWIRKPLIGWFARTYGVNLDEAESSRLDDYPSFDAFFTRALKPRARPMPAGEHIPVSPCDGTVSQLGTINSGRILQAKGIHYSPSGLLGSAELAEPFAGGRFLTIYLAPADYHRVHMPIGGRLLTEMRIPGRLFSVSEATTRVIPGLFTRNERMAALFDTAHGPMAVVMVAALLVGGIETAWGDRTSRRPGTAMRRMDPGEAVVLPRGEEMGRFHWGSSVVLLTTADFPVWSGALEPGGRIQLGTPLCRNG